jgi:hypothetical protein
MAYVVLAIMLAGLLYTAWQHAYVIVCGLLVLTVLAVVATRNTRKKLLDIAASRPSGGGICDFSRSFDLRRVDPWVVRAVYEELVCYFREQGVDMSVRADDDLIKDLCVDPEDLDMDIATDIAARTGRTFDGYKANPCFGETNTVRGLVMFFNAQPKLPNHSNPG